MEEKMYDYSYKREIGSTQLKTNTKIEVENLQKVLSITAESTITNYEVLTGELRFTGEICYICVYIDENNITRSTRHIKEFEGKIEDDSINSFTEPVLRSNVLDTKVDQIGDNQIELNSIVEVQMYSIVTESFKSLDCKNCVTKSYPITLCSVEKGGETRINLEEEFSLKEKPLEILSINARYDPTLF